ncbi:hypothetical protein A2U01_0056666, partial [Trifolium medium]|nr:hypothetical protein [Trifolium medium]
IVAAAARDAVVAMKEALVIQNSAAIKLGSPKRYISEGAH